MDAVIIPEPISPVKDFLANSKKLLIDSKRIDAVSGETFEVLYPSTNTVLTRVSKGGEVTIRNMVSSQVFKQKISTRLIKWRKDSKPE
jgi:acyl-CoA reductase-like NAD-dependent aldehyde dehydrogenase